MGRIVRYASVLGINAVPIGGLAVAAWPAGTALTLYWLEGLFAVLLVGLRIELHRRWSGKRGHFRALSQVQVSVPDTRDPVPYFLVGYLAQAVVFNAFAGVALFVALGAVLGEMPRRADVAVGLGGLLAFQLVAFAADLPALGGRPFLWLRRVAMNSLGRAGWTFLGVLVAWGVASRTALPGAFFLVFAAAKLLGDLAAQARMHGMEERLAGPRPPRWLVALMRGLGRGEGFEAYWAAEHARTRREAELDEEPAAAPWEPPPRRRRRRGPAA